jgi:hypothetical protein
MASELFSFRKRMFNVKEEAVFIGRGGFLVILHLEKNS